MALTATAAFPQGLIGKTVALTAASANPGSPTTVTNAVELCTAGADGAMITEISLIPSVAATVTNVVAIWTSTDNGTNKFLYYQQALTPDSHSTSDPVERIELPIASVQEPLILAANEKLYAGILQANPATTGWHCRVQGRNM